MSTLPPHVAALLEAAQKAHDPSPQDYARVHDALSAALIAAPVVPPDVTSVAASSAAKGVATTLWGKVLIGIALLGAPVTITVWPHADDARAPRKTLVARDETPTTSAAREPALPAAEATPVQPRVPASVADTPTRVAAASAPASAPSRRRSGLANTVRSQPAAASASATATTDSQQGNTSAPADAKASASAETSGEPKLPSREGELSLLRAALAELNRGAPERALALLNSHGERYPVGVLSDERQGLRAVALCTLGRASEAASARAAFLRAQPRSPLAARVRVSCDKEQ